VLTDIKSKAITSKYLIGILNEELFTISENECKRYSLRLMENAPNPSLLEAPRTSQKPLRFSEEHPPNKEWLVDVLFSVNPNNSLFDRAVIPIQRELKSKSAFVYF
jgi:hypothetical protein